MKSISNPEIQVDARISDGLAQVVDGGYCVGCGTCAALDPGITIKQDEMKRYFADLPRDRPPLAQALASCPFATGNPSEDEIAESLFTGSNHLRDPNAGTYLSAYAGWVLEGEFRLRGSSGGMASWLLTELLRRNLVDAVIHVAQVSNHPSEDRKAPLYAFRVSTSEDAVINNAKSRYYPVEMSDVISHIIETPGRYAVIGVPCFCKALRLAARQSAVLSERLTFIVGIVCGHLKSGAFAEALGWQCGIQPENLTAIDFRVKLEGRPASRYGVAVEGIENGRAVNATRQMEDLLGANWSHGLFKYKACEFCDDVLAETADVVLGDAWLPEYENDYRGTNIIVVRNSQITDLLSDAANKERVHLEDIPIVTAVKSQAGGFRHRRNGLAYRLWMEDEAGAWRPEKRVIASRSGLSRRLQRVHRLRYELGQASHSAFLSAKKERDFSRFINQISPLTRRLSKAEKSPLPIRAARYLKRKLRSILKRN